MKGDARMAKGTVIDVHCHLFGAKFAVMELAAATWAIIRKEYPYGVKPRGVFEPLKVLARVQGVADLAAYAARLITVATGDEKDNYELQVESFRKSLLGKKDLVVAPLMMDVYFALHDNKRFAGAKGSGAKGFEIDPVEMTDFNAHLDSIKRLVEREKAKIASLEGTAVRRGKDEAVDRIFGDVRKEFMKGSARGSGTGYEGIQMTPGYKYQLEELEALAKGNEGRIYPFLAIDPRREGFMELVKMKAAEENGAFKGIKLYPPLGYLPSHESLKELYEYCEKHRIPVTVHCSLGGMQNFRRFNRVTGWDRKAEDVDFKSKRITKSGFYADPAGWEPVLDEFPELKLNLGHFGGPGTGTEGSVNKEWVDTIRRLMAKFPNVYADIGYVSDMDRAAETLELIEADTLLKQRVMFGTDYVMVMMDLNLGGLDKYFNSYYGLDAELISGNARRFLGI
ncbi:amidohydrolase family protein [Youngiibacter multivorans]|uniref:TIM-barrel fold metal-dependent hydrolase n=1 Tax=Youngiibacter multivorans TaxID=937251 RepID=A0ABS4FZS7_9CLOT|nr:amidohydrolase family protein [Youngiibacter multivorans]MBP1917801.1 putative TIM-barrel fold metal-dependent hydrolase [Youngiibacter multivorans]